MSSAYQMERTEVSNCGLGRRPESRTVISNDQFSKLLQFREINCINICNQDGSVCWIC